MKLVKRIAIFSTVCVLATNTIACSKNIEDDILDSRIYDLEDLDIDSNHAVSNTLEEVFSIDISDEDSEFLDQDVVLMALNQKKMESKDFTELASIAKNYVSLRIKEDNPDYVASNIVVSDSMKSQEPVVFMDNRDYQLGDMIYGIATNISQLEEESLDNQSLEACAKEVAVGMMQLAVVDTEVETPILGDGKIYVKERK